MLADNPRLTTRLPAGGRNPARIVLDGRLRTGPQASVYDAAAPGRRLLVTADGTDPARLAAFREQGVATVTVPRCQGQLDLDAVMDRLGALGLQTVLVESGGALNGALLRAGLVDRLMLFVAPLLFGGGDGRPLFAGAGAARLAEAVPVADLRVSRVGTDLLLEGEVSRCSPD